MPDELFLKTENVIWKKKKLETLEFLKNSTDEEFWTDGVYKMGNENYNNQADLKRNENKGSIAEEKRAGSWI